MARAVFLRPSSLAWAGFGSAIIAETAQSAIAMVRTVVRFIIGSSHILHAVPRGPGCTMGERGPYLTVTNESRSPP